MHINDYETGIIEYSSGVEYCLWPAEFFYKPVSLLVRAFTGCTSCASCQ